MTSFSFFILLLVHYFAYDDREPIQMMRKTVVLVRQSDIRLLL